jgi:hypothetical protein
MILSEARESLYDVVVPHIDSEDNVDRVDKYLNLAQERLINSGKWKGTIREVAVTAPEEFITLPPRFHSCLAIKFVDGTDYSPASIRNQWYRYLTGGSCYANQTTWFSSGYGPVVDDLGDGYCTFANSPYDSYYLKFTRANAGDNGLQILVKGYDTDGNIIFTDAGSYSYEGLITTLSAATVTTSQVFTNQIYFLQKQVSQGFITLDAVDVATGATTQIGYYMPSEQAPSYRRYLTGDITNTFDSVNAMCKLRYVPAVVDSDEVIPSNLGALRNTLIALKHEDEGDKNGYRDFFGDAIKLLNDETRESRGGAKFSLNIDSGAYQFDNLWQGR